jgi:hypothetical protein
MSTCRKLLANMTDLVPRSLFAAEGAMACLHCQTTLVAILEKLTKTRIDASTRQSEDGDAEGGDAENGDADADGMAEVQSMPKPDWVNNCAQLAEHYQLHI